MANTKQRLFVVNLFAMACVVLAIAGGNFLVDPYNVRGPNEDGLKKEEVAYYNDRCLWKLSAYENDPRPRVLLGDSRAGNLSPPLLADTGGDNYYNFAFGGGTLREMISIFDWITRRPEQKAALADNLKPPPPRQELTSVIFGLNVVHFNAQMQADRVGQAEELYDSRFRYLMSPNITATSFQVLNYNYFGGEAGSEKPPMNPDAFWKFQIEVTSRNQFRDFIYYENGVRELREIAEYCQQHDIALAAVIFPEHEDYLARIADFDQQENYDRFRSDVAEIFPVVFDFSDLPGNAEAENFRDPAHFESDYARQWLPQVFEALP